MFGGPGGGPHQVVGGRAQGFQDIVPIIEQSKAMENGLKGPIPPWDIHGDLYQILLVDSKVQ